MPAIDIDPLDPDTWFDQARLASLELQRLSHLDAIERLLRRAYHHLQLTPRPLRLFFCPKEDEETFERYLECGAYDAAALSLVGGKTELSLTRSGRTGLYEAKISFDGGPRSGQFAEDHSLAKAVLAAWFYFIVSVEFYYRDITRPTSISQTYQGQRKGRYVPPLQ